MACTIFDGRKISNGDSPSLSATEKSKRKIRRTRSNFNKQRSSSSNSELVGFREALVGRKCRESLFACPTAAGPESEVQTPGGRI